MYIQCMESCCEVCVHCLSPSHHLPLYCDTVSYQCHFSCYECSSALLSLSSPASLIYLLQLTRDTHNFYYIKFLSIVYGIWNLDFFHSLIPPICLPLNTMQMMALDYLVAVYPLFLLTCFYGLLKAHDRECRLVVRLWRPFLWCTARLRQQWNIRRSITGAFATFLLVSYVKLVNVSD